jgi:hypothetical protein
VNVQAQPARGLESLEHVRIYVPPTADEDAVQSLATDAFSRGSTSLEFIRADLCRADLLVEIEGIARIA